MIVCKIWHVQQFNQIIAKSRKIQEVLSFLSIFCREKAAQARTQPPWYRRLGPDVCSASVLREVAIAFGNWFYKIHGNLPKASGNVLLTLKYELQPATGRGIEYGLWNGIMQVEYLSRCWVQAALRVPALWRSFKTCSRHICLSFCPLPYLSPASPLLTTSLGAVPGFLVVQRSLVIAASLWHRLPFLNSLLLNTF